MGELDINAILGPAGSISRRIGNYEHRNEQIAMAEAVGDALRNRNHLIVEAGTGVGKSFGYLVPAILHATSAENAMAAKDKPAEPIKNKQKPRGEEEEAEDTVKRIIVSTHTISLQEQLIFKDLPLLKAVIPREFTSVLVKGRGNYMSKRRLELADSRSVSLWSNEQDHEHLNTLKDWSRTTNDGSLSSLAFRPPGNVWDEVASDSGNCMGRKCKHHDSCFYYAARRRVQNSQILIVNHALFFSDLALRAQGGGILPKYDSVIFDECHTIEAVAGEHLGLQISNSQIDYTLRKLYNPRTEKGILVALGLRQLTQDTYRCMESLDDLTADLAGWQAGQEKTNGRVRAPLLIETVLSERLQTLSEQLERYGQDLKDANSRLELMSASQRLSSLAASIDQLQRMAPQRRLGACQQPASSFGGVAHGVQAGQAGLQRAGKGVGKHQHVLAPVEARVQAPGLPAQPAQVPHTMPEPARPRRHRPAIGGQQLADPGFADQMQRMAVRLQQLQRRQAEHDIAHVVAQADDERMFGHG